MSDALPIAGRRYQPVGESTLEHDFWLLERLRRAGLDAIAVDPGADFDATARKIVTDAFAAGVAFDLLGGVLVPEGTPGEAWTPELAAETSAWAAKVADPEGKKLLQAAFVSALLGFFASGLVSFKTSPRSSSGPGEGAGPGASENGGPTGGAGATGTGARSFAS